MDKHLNIRVSGRVQGIFFRYFAKQKARELGIKGFVRNEADGSVYIEVEGGEEDLKKFLDWCRKGPVLASVEKVDFEVSELKNFRGFKVR